MRKSLLLLVVLSACGIPEPFNQETAAPMLADQAAFIVQRGWEQEFGPLCGRPEIRWFGPVEGRSCLDFGPDYRPGGCIQGIYWQAWGSGEEQIQLLNYPTFHQSAMAHEMLHWAFDQATDNDGDPDHLEPMWDKVKDIEQLLIDAGM